MTRKNSGYTLVEIVIVVAVVSILSLAAAESMRYLNHGQVSIQASADMEGDAIRIFRELTLTLKRAGDGVRNVPGNPLIYQYDDDSMPPCSTSTCDRIFFFYKDSGSSFGAVDDKDAWLRYSAQNGALMKEAFRAASASQIECGAASCPLDACPVASGPCAFPPEFLKMSPGVRIKSLNFSFYNGTGAAGETAQASTAASASYVKVYLELERSGKALIKTDWIYLSNIVHAPTS